jgi:hypothetical protein
MGAGRCSAHLDRTCSVVHQSACSRFLLVGPTLESLAAFGGLVRCSSPLQTWLLRGRRSAGHVARFLSGHWAPPPVHGLRPSLGTLTSMACGLGCSQTPVWGFSVDPGQSLACLRRAQSVAPFKIHFAAMRRQPAQRRLCNGEATSLSGGRAAVFKEKTFSAGACGLTPFLDILPRPRLLWFSGDCPLACATALRLVRQHHAMHPLAVSQAI